MHGHYNSLLGKKLLAELSPIKRITMRSRKYQNLVHLINLIADIISEGVVHVTHD